MKKTLILLLVVLVAVTGLPILVGMHGMPFCQQCSPATVVASCGLAIFAAAASLLLALVALRLRRRDEMLVGLLHGFTLERPPQYLA